MKTVMVFGAFDILHKGHHYFLKKAKSYGDKLIVVVARDCTLEHVKSRKPYHSQETRLQKVSEIEYVERAVLGNLGDKYQVICDENPDILVFGYDQHSFNIGIEEELKKRGIGHINTKTITSSLHPEIYKSSIIYKKLNKREYK